MKKLIFLFVILFSAHLAEAQAPDTTKEYITVPGYGGFLIKSKLRELGTLKDVPYIRFDGRELVDIRKATPKQLAVIYSRERIRALGNVRFFNQWAGTEEGMFPRHSLVVRFEEGTGAEVYRGIDWMSGTLKSGKIIVNGASSIEIADLLITPENAKDYRYRIIRNDNTALTGWTIPNNFKKIDGGKYVLAYLGKIDYEPNQFVQVEIYNIHNYKDRDALIIDWRPTRKLVAWFGVDYKNRRAKALNHASLGWDKKTAEKRQVNFVDTDTLSDVKIRLADSLVRISINSQNLATAYNYKMTLKRTIDGKTDIVDLGEFNKSYLLYKEFWNVPGRYQLSFTPMLTRYGGNTITYVNPQTLNYTFTVLPPLHTPRLFSSKELALIGVILCGLFGAMLAVVVTRLKKKNAKNMLKEQQQKEYARTQLNSIRAQLNPHFMFNALAGIQNLMNKNETDKANRYLGKFARITRSVLNNKELITLAEEQALLNDYLQMEQLRFGFTYAVVISSELDNNIEIPAMLIQPFVENSVKHGMSKKANGEIKVEFSADGQDLVLTISDNGDGFNSGADHEGFGLKLSRNRISLLNTIYVENEIRMKINSGANGTTVIVTLKQWL